METGERYTPPDYVRCAVCDGAFRPASSESVDAHRVSTGHAPVPAGEPVTVPETAPQRLLLAAARRLRALHETFDALDELAETWERTGHGDRADELRALLVRPVVRPLDDDAEHDDGSSS